jgi:predicted O-methyltransferase YrrM
LLSPLEIESLFRSYWKPGFGSVSPEDLKIIQDLVHHYKPSSVLEIGMASGLSAAFISLFMDELGNSELVTIDHDNTFFGDKQKENGFLIDSIYKGSKVRIHKKPFTTSLDLDTIDKTYDMAFIDANHQHPWPTIDLLMTFPKLRNSKIILFDDLDLYTKQADGRGIGPKILFDQFNHIVKHRPSQKDDLFYLDLSCIGMGRLLEAACSSLFFPWSPAQVIPASTIKRIQQKIKETYGDHLLNVFSTCNDRYNRKAGMIQ